MLIEMLAAMAVVSSGAAAAQEPAVGARAAPRGDYRDSCSGEYVNRGRLYADCRTERGQIRGTSIELNRCSDYQIRNINGLLVCGPNRGEFEDQPGGGNGGGNGGGWPGNGDGRGSITVYRDSNFRGPSFRFDNEVSNLASTGFNDSISSMRFRGEWEACSDAYFRGQCQTFRDDVANLRNWGLNDRISSLRAVRRGGGRW